MQNTMKNNAEKELTRAVAYYAKRYGIPACVIRNDSKLLGRAVRAYDDEIKYA